MNIPNDVLIHIGSFCNDIEIRKLLGFNGVYPVKVSPIFMNKIKWKHFDWNKFAYEEKVFNNKRIGLYVPLEKFKRKYKFV